MDDQVTNSALLLFQESGARELLRVKPDGHVVVHPDALSLVPADCFSVFQHAARILWDSIPASLMRAAATQHYVIMFSDAAQSRPLVTVHLDHVDFHDLDPTPDDECFFHAVRHEYLRRFEPVRVH